MIEAGLEFPHSARRLVLETFLSLPRQLCPSHQSESEDEVAKGIKDRHEFFQSALKRETGFFLRARISRVISALPIHSPYHAAVSLIPIPFLRRSSWVI